MKRLILVLMLGVLLVVGCQGLPEALSPTPTEVVEPTPTPIPPTPTPVPPTPTPTPTPEPTPTPTPEPIRYIGLPPAEVQRLREQCLKENLDSLCLPLPLDPTQPGVEMIFAHADYTHTDGKHYHFEAIAFKAPEGTAVLAPADGVKNYGCPDSYCKWGEPYIKLHDPTGYDLNFEAGFPVYMPDLQYQEVRLGELLFRTKGEALSGIWEYYTWFDQSGQPVEYQLFLWVWGPNPEWGCKSCPVLLTQDDLLLDEEGRIVYIQL